MSDLFALLPIREFLNQINYQPESPRERIAWTLLHPLNFEVLKARKDSHLTEATEKGHQIRFPLQDRVDRMIRTLAVAAIKNIQPHQNLHIPSTMNSPTEYFFNTLKSVLEIKKIPVHYSSDSSFPVSLNSNEEEIFLRWQKKGDMEPQDFDFLKDRAHSYIYAGDYWTAFNILSACLPNFYTDTTLIQMGLCQSFFKNTVEAESYYQKVYESGAFEGQVNSAYLLSMLYLRHHPAILHDQKKAETFLNKALDLIQMHPQHPDYNFMRVFNRNGFALCLYRSGKNEEALSLLETGIEKLSLSNEASAQLHRSVLMYNSTHCYRSLGQKEQTKFRFQQLIDTDLKFPEYRLDYAKYLMDLGEHQEAEIQISEALRLDPFISEAWILLGLLKSEDNRWTEAIEISKSGLILDPNNSTLLAHTSYYLVEAGFYSEALELINLNFEKVTDPESLELLLLNKADCYLKLGEKNQAYDCLVKAKIHLPQSQVINENLAQLQEGAQL